MGAFKIFRRFGELLDRETVDLPTINGPLGTALGLKANASAVSNVDNTSDADKPVSTAQQAALDLKANSADLGTAAARQADQDLQTTDDPTFQSVTLNNGLSESELQVYGSDDGAGNTAFASLTHDSSGDLTIQTEAGGTGTAGDINLFAGSGNINLGRATIGNINEEATTRYSYNAINSNSLYFHYEARLNNTATNPNIQFGTPESYRKKIISASGKQTWMKLNVPVAQSGTASYTGLDIDALEDSLGSGQSYLIQAGVNGNYHFNVTREGDVGIGTTTPARKLHVSDAMRLEPTTAPASPAAGDLYFDLSTNKLRCYDGTAWNDLF